MVVRVVLSECSEAWGEEKVLPPLAKVVVRVSAVGAVLLLLVARAWAWPAALSPAEVKLAWEHGVRGVARERSGGVVVDVAGVVAAAVVLVLVVPDSG